MSAFKKNTIQDYSKEERSVIENRDFILVKKDAISKTCQNFNLLRNTLAEIVRSTQIEFPENTDITTGKTAKGESFKSLPYVVLDYPKLFSKESVFAFRSMFWWGNFFSFTLHLQGKALEQFRSALEKNSEAISRESDTFLCVNKHPWDYRYHKENYTPVSNLSIEELHTMFRSKDFIKISRKIPLSENEKLISEGRSAFEDFLTFLK